MTIRLVPMHWRSVGRGITTDELMKMLRGDPAEDPSLNKMTPVSMASSRPVDAAPDERFGSAPLVREFRPELERRDRRHVFQCDEKPRRRMFLHVRQPPFERSGAAVEIVGQHAAKHDGAFVRQ